LDCFLLSKTDTLTSQAAVANEHGIAVDGITVDDVVITSGSKKGDGFVCDIAAITFNATFDGRRVEKNYIAKFWWKCYQTFFLTLLPNKLECLSLVSLFSLVYCLRIRPKPTLVEQVIQVLPLSLVRKQ
jgi:hypothetical protein